MNDALCIMNFFVPLYCESERRGRGQKIAALLG